MAKQLKLSAGARSKIEAALALLDAHGSAPFTGEDLTGKLKSLGMTMTTPKDGGCKVSLAGIAKTATNQDGATRVWAQKARRALRQSVA